MKGGLRTKDVLKESRPGQPLVSIVTVVLNGEKHIEQAIQSVLKQNYSNIEYILIDGQSNDNTLNIIKSYSDKIDYWESEKDLGIFDAMNKGISLARGEIVGLLNADDFYDEGIIERVVNTFSETNADAIHGNISVMQKNGEQVHVPDITMMNFKPSVFHPTCFVKKSVYRKVGLFDPRFKISSDYEFLLRCIRRNVRFHYLPRVITHFRPGGMSAKCASNIEGYKIMKIHKTGYHRQVIWRGIRCYTKHFLKKILNLKG